MKLSVEITEYKTAFISAGKDNMDSWSKKAAKLEVENERLQALVDIENTYGHLYLVAMRILKDEHGDELYWELFDKTCQHFDALLAGEQSED